MLSIVQTEQKYKVFLKECMVWHKTRENEKIQIKRAQQNTKQ